MGEEETVVNVHRSYLPSEVGQDDVLRLKATINHEETQRQREDVRAKIERLKRLREEGEACEEE